MCISDKGIGGRLPDLLIEKEVHKYPSFTEKLLNKRPSRRRIREQLTVNRRANHQTALTSGIKQY